MGSQVTLIIQGDDTFFENPPKLRAPRGLPTPNILSRDQYSHFTHPHAQTDTHNPATTLPARRPTPRPTRPAPGEWKRPEQRALQDPGVGNQLLHFVEGRVQVLLVAIAGVAVPRPLLDLTTSRGPKPSVTGLPVRRRRVIRPTTPLRHCPSRSVSLPPNHPPRDFCPRLTRPTTWQGPPNQARSPAAPQPAPTPRHEDSHPKGAFPLPARSRPPPELCRSGREPWGRRPRPGVQGYCLLSGPSCRNLVRAQSAWTQP